MVENDSMERLRGANALLGAQFPFLHMAFASRRCGSAASPYMYLHVIRLYMRIYTRDVELQSCIHALWSAYDLRVTT
jgi:hypothetical protein